MEEKIAQAIWDWLHGTHLVDEGTPDEYEAKNVSIWSEYDKSEIIGFDAQINVYDLAKAIKKAITPGYFDIERFCEKE